MHLRRVDMLRPQGKPVPVAGDHVEIPVLGNVEQGAGHDRLVLVQGNCMGSLVDHGFQLILGHQEPVLIADLRQIRILLRRHGGNAVLGYSAGDADIQHFIRLKGQDLIAHFPGDLAEQPGIHHKFTAVLGNRLNGGTDSQLQIIAGQLQHRVGQLDPDALQGGNGGFDADRFGYVADGSADIFLLA